MMQKFEICNNFNDNSLITKKIFSNKALILYFKFYTISHYQNYDVKFHHEQNYHNNNQTGFDE